MFCNGCLTKLIVSCVEAVANTLGEDVVVYASDYCHWDCHFPYSVKDVVDCQDLSFAQKEKLLGKNAVDFFELKNLPQPKALKLARQTWNEGQAKAASA